MGSRSEVRGTAAPASACRVESLLTVDERGQMVLPKEVRQRAGIRPGEKMALITWEQDGAVCCLSLVRAQELTGMVRTYLSPMMTQIAAG
ncbi:MAG: HgcAB-associated protein [Gemmatimonadota bacterium]